MIILSRTMILFSCLVILTADIARSQTSDSTITIASNNAKPAIDFTAIDNWLWMPGSRVAISDNGRYWSHMIAKANGADARTIIQTTAGEVRYTLNTSQQGFFSGDSHWYIYQSKDSLFFLPLVAGQSKLITGVNGYQINQGLRRGADKIKWLAYQLKDTARTLILHHFESDREVHIASVAAYSFDGSGRWLVCRLNGGGLLLHPLAGKTGRRLTDINQYLLDKTGKVLYYVKRNGTGLQIERMNLADGKVAVVWESTDPVLAVNSLVVNENGSEILFVLKEKKGAGAVSSIWYWGNNMVKAVERLRDGSVDIAKGLCIGGSPSFSDNGKYILIDLKPLPIAAPKPKADAVQVDIWHYRDTVIQSAQLLYGKSDYSHRWLEPRSYRAVLPVMDGRLMQLEEELKRITLITGESALLWRDNMLDEEFEGEGERESAADSVWLVSLRDGNRRFWQKQYLSTPITTSTGNQYLLWFDRNKGHYFTYNLKTRKEVNISASVPVYLGTEMGVDPLVRRSNGLTGIIGWLKKDEGLLVYDTYDIWQLDPNGSKTPICITNNYGRRHGIKLRLTKGMANNLIDKRQPIDPHTSLLLSAFNIHTMENGFYRTSLDRHGDPVKLFMGHCVVDLTKDLIPNNGDLPSDLMNPVRARDTMVWIVCRQSVTEAPNYYVTHDFIKYKILTNSQLQNKYTWMRNELIQFKQKDGTMSQGILYKPETFDSTKRYPVIIKYYFQFSHLLNAFQPPRYISNAALDIAWFVSHGYLVFTPDIYFTYSRPRPASAWNTVEGAGIHLKTLSYVDGKRMGITGHSRAGGYTNYIITHSKQFAAAVEGAGVSNWVSAQHTLIYTTGQVRSTTGQEPYVFTNKQFMRDNPILNADRVRCPLLIFHNKLDGAVPWEQGVELYIALRRLGKPVWMLQYDGESHSLLQKKAKQDLTIRVMQYLDHYLKGTAPPRWMTVGVPARLKGIDTGLEPDSSGRKP